MGKNALEEVKNSIKIISKRNSAHDLWLFGEEMIYRNYFHYEWLIKKR